MRDSLKELFNNVVTLQYTLPHNDILKTKVSTRSDFAFKSHSDSEIADLIYNSIVDLAFDDYQIDINSLNDLQKTALQYRIRFNVKDDDTKLKLGFYGEALLNVFLQLFFGTDVLVARGEFFDILSQSEVHGYDSHHIIEKNNSLEFWFGEAKFYTSYTSALENVWKNISKDITFEFLNKNLQAIIQKKLNIFAEGKLIDNFIKDCREKPYRNYYDDIKRYGGKLVYPVLVASNELKKGFNETIKTYVDKINDLYNAKPIVMPTNLSVELFFIFLPVQDAKSIKLEVLECIQKNKPLI